MSRNANGRKRRRNQEARLGARAREVGATPPPAKVRRQGITVEGCGKRGYATKAAAKLALREVRGVRRGQRAAGRGVPGKCERTPYRCDVKADGSPGCGMWHLTSMPKEASARVRAVRRWKAAAGSGVGCGS